MRPENPRFPHTCVIWRQTVETPLVDEDLDYDPSFDSSTSSSGSSFSDAFADLFTDESSSSAGTESSTGSSASGSDSGSSGSASTSGSASSSGSSSSSSEESASKTIIYRGECRAYDKNTTSDRGEVITSYRGLALPLTREDWQELGVIPQTGDEIKVDRGGYVEYGKVVDKNPGNFGGTHLIWRYGRN